MSSQCQNLLRMVLNHTLVKAIRTMPCDAKLPQQFWADALSTAVYWRNQSPSKVLPGMMLFDALTAEKPTVQHLHTFGCVAYSHVPNCNNE